MKKRYIETWQDLLDGNADELAVEGAHRLSFALAAAGCTLMHVSLAGLVLAQCHANHRWSIIWLDYGISSAASSACFRLPLITQLFRFDFNHKRRSRL